MYEKFRGNLKWYKDLEAQKFSWKPSNKIDLSNNTNSFNNKLLQS